MRCFAGPNVSFTYKATSQPYLVRIFSIRINSVIFYTKESKFLVYQPKINPVSLKYQIDWFLFGAIGVQTKNCQNMRPLFRFGIQLHNAR